MTYTLSKALYQLLMGATPPKMQPVPKATPQPPSTRLPAGHYWGCQFCKSAVGSKQIAGRYACDNCFGLYILTIGKQ